ncbi:oligosaccharide flippase family protein [Paenibacillus sp. MBLB4367]|uniref:putative polysaccharide biosynthesis protein n=1 Tax=Paenibacillus sp. MBLB4367 TaxID=3384767 RepID=UPI003907F383
MDVQVRENKAATALWKGAAVLGLATIVSKLLGTLQKIPLQNIAGDGVFGIYNAVQPIYLLILTLATAGFPVAVSKFVSEHMALGQRAEAKRITAIAAGALAVSGFAGFCLLFFGAGGIAALMRVQQSERAIQSVAFALLLVPLMSVIRGYYQGLHNMVPTAVSQVAEQLIRVAVMLGLLFYMLGGAYGDDWVAAGATFGAAAGAAAGLAVMLLYLRSSRRSALRAAGKTRVPGRDEPQRAPDGDGMLSQSGKAAYEPAAVLLRRFLAYALPVGFGSLVVPLLALVDSFTIPRLLIEAGSGEEAAIASFGLYNHGQPLVQLVVMIAGSMSAALIPAVAEAKLKRRKDLIESRAALTMRLTWLLGLASAFGLAVAAPQLNVMFFASADGSLTMAIIAFTALFGTVSVVSGSLLQGLGLAGVPARNLLLAAIAKIALNALLVPAYGIAGAAYAAVLAYALAAALNVARLRRCAGTTATGGAGFARPLAAVAAMCAAVWATAAGAEALLAALPHAPSHRIAQTAAALAAIGAGALVYAAALLRAGALTRRELAQVPGFAKAEPLLERLRLLR